MRIKCHECHEYGHYANECPTLDNEETSSPNVSSSTSNVHVCLMARGINEVSSSHSYDNDESDDETNNDMSQEIYGIG